MSVCIETGLQRLKRCCYMFKEQTSIDAELTDLPPQEYHPNMSKQEAGGGARFDWRAIQANLTPSGTTFMGAIVGHGHRGFAAS